MAVMWLSKLFLGVKMKTSFPKVFKTVLVFTIVLNVVAVSTGVQTADDGVLLMSALFGALINSCILYFIVDFLQLPLFRDAEVVRTVYCVKECKPGM